HDPQRTRPATPGTGRNSPVPLFVWHFGAQPGSLRTASRRRKSDHTIRRDRKRIYMMSQLRNRRWLPAAFRPVGRQTMNPCRIAAVCLMLSGALFAFQPMPVAAEGQDARDGQHDFDFEIGTWSTRLSLLQR